MSQKHKWVVCSKALGNIHAGDIRSRRIRNFEDNSVARALEKPDEEGHAAVWLIGRNEVWTVSVADVEDVEVTKTGDKHQKKICNICHCLKPVEQFGKNQNNIHGIVRRPSCMKCRTDIDKRAPKSNQARRMERKRPVEGSPFTCPICQKRSIAGVTAKIVADHDHHTGNIRDFICDSCNTGLGRFKNGEDCLENAIAYLRERDTLN